MPPLPSEWLRDIGVAEFGSSGASDIQRYAQGWAQIRAKEPNDEISFRAFIELGAVEFALVPLYRGSFMTEQNQILESVLQTEQTFPVHVSESAVADAVYKTDCGPFIEHSRKSWSELRAWDLFTFAGDMSKFELLSVSDDINILANPENMQALVDALAERYTQAGLGSRVVESGLLAAQGLVWFAKLAALRDEDYTKTQGLHFAERFLRGTATM